MGIVAGLSLTRIGAFIVAGASMVLGLVGGVLLADGTTDACTTVTYPGTGSGAGADRNGGDGSPQ